MVNTADQNPLWQRLKVLTPSLPYYLHIHRRDEAQGHWYILEDQSKNRFHRLSAAAKYLLDGMNGQNNLEQILNQAQHSARQAKHHELPNEHDLIQLIQYLYVADLLIADMRASTQDLFKRKQKNQHAPWLRLLSNPISWNINLGNPEKILTKLHILTRTITTKWMAIVWLVLMSYTATQIVANWNLLLNTEMDEVFSFGNLALLWLCYPLLKLCHELGHALFCRAWGGQVNQWGIIFILATPLPYVDASSATRFSAKHRRLMVSAAGMATELFIAALALLLWFEISPGLLRNILFNIVIIGGISTLLFNANPLIRFDGYHIFTDAFNLPNLASRANACFRYALNKAFSIDTSVAPPADNPHKITLFISYAILAFVYRLVVMLAILFIAATYAPTLALLLGSWLLLMQLIVPASKLISSLFQSALHAKKTLIFSFKLISFLLVTSLSFTMIPLPNSTKTEAVIWLNDELWLKADTDGFLQKLYFNDGDSVAAGQIIATLKNDELNTKLAQEKAHKQEFIARYEQAWLEDRPQAQLLQLRITNINNNIGELERLIDTLTIRSQHAGKLRILQPQLAPGHFFAKGEKLGLIDNNRAMSLKAALTQNQAGKVKSDLQTVKVRLIQQPSITLSAIPSSSDIVASRSLPSAALGVLGGGKLPTEINDTTGTMVKNEVFIMTLGLVDQSNIGLFGGRAQIKFSHSPQSAYQQLNTLIEQIFMDKFE